MANKSTLISRRNYGMKIAMPGFDVRTAGDNQLLFNSSFPILQIKALAALGTNSDNMHDTNFGGEYLGNEFSFHVHRWYHGLGYPPLFIILNKEGTQYNNEYAVDNQFIYTIKQNPRRKEEWVLLCPINIREDIEYPYTARPVEIDDYTKNAIGNYGFKSIKYGSMTDDNFDNLGFSMRLQSQMVLAIKTDDTVIGKPTGQFDQFDVEYRLPKGMTVNDVMVYGMYESKILNTDKKVWSHTAQYGQGAPAIFIDRANNRAYMRTTVNIPVSMVVTRLPMVATHRTEGTF